MSTLTRTSASHSPPSLPSFAQTFSNISHAAPMVNLAKISIASDGHQANDMDTLPPIHHNVPQNDAPEPARHPEHQSATRMGKKRSLEHDESPKGQVREVKRPVEPNTQRAPSAVKQEMASLSPSPDVSQMEHDELDASPPPRRPTKKRRVNPAPGPPKSQPAVDRETSVSPDVAAFTAPNSDQGAFEQVRATLSIKQKQKEIIEQRRGSTAGLPQSASTGAPPRPGPPVRRQSGTSTNSAPTGASSQQHPSPQQQHAQPAQHPTPPHHFSPPHQSLPAPNNSFSNSRRRRGTLQINGHTLSSDPAHSLTQPSRLPPPILTPSTSTPTSHTFPQPLPPHPQTQVQPIVRTPAIAKSSTTRAAPPKPLTIAPHGHSRRLEPLVHSAPVIGGFGPVRVPELPPIPITPGSRKVSGGMLGPGVSGGANIAIARSGGMRTAGLGLGPGRFGSSSGAGTVPPTPAYASLSSQQQQKVTSQDGKGGFLQLFENFYDSLADSRLLKQWLQEQLAKSNTLLEQLGKLEKERESSGVTLSQVEELIERRVGPMRNEVEGLKRRVGELEEMLYKERQRGGVGVARRESYAPNTEFEEEKGPNRRASARSSDVGGYVFPERRDEAGERDWDRDREKDREREHGSTAGSLHSSPSFDQHRLSTSAVRLESGPSHSHVHPVFPLPSSSSQHRPSPLGLERERERERESSRTWERRRHNTDSTSNSNTNGRHDTDRERAPSSSSSMQTQTRAPSA